MTTKIWWEPGGIQDLLTGDAIANAEREIMEAKLSEIQGQFITDFGFEGSFKVEQRTTSPSAKFGTSRTAFKVVANDAKTGAVLKRHPGWLGKFAG